MDLHLPIAGVTENLFLLIGIGSGVGVLSGLLGVGGGFLLTPILILLGIPAPVAVASGANQVVGSSVSGVLAHWRRGNVDVKMGLILLAGGLVGSTLGIGLFRLLARLGQIDLIINLAYVVLLGAIGALMLVESLQAFRRRRRTGAKRIARGPGRHLWMHGLPLKTRFRRSRVYISAIVPAALGLVVGVLSAIMGVGGGFIMVPAMIYLLGMPTEVVIGTSLMQIIFVTANVTFLHAVSTQSVDVFLVTPLLIGGVVGAQYGARWGAKLPADRMRLLMAVLVLGFAAELLVGLVAVPESLYVLARPAGG
ncbi:MAG: sulfite exporter TauE/SafE family protein [Proteobacteria bacterium]|nr:sulfite exporter TauE/SafE family protein [Pseudomonadota bacterium]